MAANNFKVIAAGIPATRQEYMEAMLLPLTELPALSETDQQTVERFKLDPETRRRHAEARRRARERERRQGVDLGVCLQKLIDRVDGRFQVELTQRVVRPNGWYVRLDRSGLQQEHMTLEMETVERLLARSTTDEEMHIFTEHIAKLLGEPSLQRVRV